MIEISLLCLDQYTLDELTTDELVPEKIVTAEADDCLDIECFFVQEQKSVNTFFAFVFNDPSELPQLYNRDGMTIYDLSGIKNGVLSFEKLEKHYEDWLSQSGHENTMDEYGMLIGVVGFIDRNQHRKNLLAVVRDINKA